MSFALVVALSASLFGQTPQDGPIATAIRPVETAEALRIREAAAYAHALPPGAPTEDYPLVAWCQALVEGHVALGESLTSGDPLDADIIRLGKLEATDFRIALQTAAGRQNTAVRAAGARAAAEAAAKWAPLMTLEEPGRSQAFGLFFGLPGRCEHAARRIRNGVTTPPATLADVGISESSLPEAP